MGFLLTLRIAVRALAKNKLRAGLTVLGVVIGIAAVTTMVSLGQSASQLVQGQFQGLGTNVDRGLSGQSAARRRAAGPGADADRGRFRRDRRAVPVGPGQLAAGRGTQAQVIYGNSNYKPPRHVSASAPTT